MRAVLILLGVLAVLVPAPGVYAQLPACGESVEPTCDGFCTTPGEFCTGLAGACGCAPSGGGGCGMIVGSPMCLGDCPPLEACFSVAGVCTCQPDPPACGESVEPTCDGFCTTPGEFCTGLAGACGCAPSGGGGCGMIVGSPMCLGDCPPFQACFSVVGVCECRGAAICGNGIPEAGEECDDGNNQDGDGCSADCEVEPPVAVPTLPQWGLFAFAALLLGGTFFVFRGRLSRLL